MSTFRHSQSSSADQADLQPQVQGRGALRNSEQALLAESVYPRVVTIGGELVEATTREEHNEALALIDRIEAQLGADLDSPGGMKSLTAFYKRREVKKELGLSEPPDPSTRQLSPWTLVDLRAIENIMTLVAPALAKNPREGLRFAKIDDEVTREIAEARYLGDDGKRETDMMVFTPSWSRQQGDNYTGAPPDNRERTVAHEIAHDLFSHKEKDWERRIKFYRDDEPNAEQPPSAWQRPAEDLAESVALYLLDRLDRHPERRVVVEEYLAEAGILEHVRAQHALRRQRK